jgi:hypothetical protein
MNLGLLPELDYIEYSDGRSAKLKHLIVRDLYKIYYEYIKRYVVFKTAKENHKQDVLYKTDLNKNFLTNLEINSKLISYIPEEVFTRNTGVNKRFIRSIETLNNTLHFLEKWNTLKM